MLYYFFFSFSISQIEFSFLTFCKTVIMGKNEYDAIRGYLLTNVIPPEIKSDYKLGQITNNYNYVGEIPEWCGTYCKQDQFRNEPWFFVR